MSKRSKMAFFFIFFTLLLFTIIYVYVCMMYINNYKQCLLKESYSPNKEMHVAVYKKGERFLSSEKIVEVKINEKSMFTFSNSVDIMANLIPPEIVWINEDNFIIYSTGDDIIEVFDVNADNSGKYCLTVFAFKGFYNEKPYINKIIPSQSNVQIIDKNIYLKEENPQ